MAEGNYSLADIAAAMGGNGGFGGMGGSWLAILFLIILFGGNGGFGNNAFANAIGYENLATSNEVQRGFDNQNSLANQREILSATNQVYHDLATVIGDKYGELTRDIYGVSGQVAQVLANQNQCCCDTKMLISETAAQNRYDALKNTNEINAVTIGQTQKILDALAQSKIEDLQGKVAQLELANQLSGVVRYPNGWTYNAGQAPFCNGCGCMA